MLQKVNGVYITRDSVNGAVSPRRGWQTTNPIMTQYTGRSISNVTTAGRSGVRIVRMPYTPNRRSFLRKSLAVAGGVAAGSTFDHLPLVARLRGETTAAADLSSGKPPAGKIGKLEVTRLICGGNLFSGFAHSGDLLYVSSLLKHYFTADKVLDTLQQCEEAGINTAILRTDDHIIGIIKRYRKERGGKIQWIAQTYPKTDNVRQNIQMAIDNGAVGAFPMGGIADTWHKEGRTELIGEAIAFMKQNGLVAGIGSHSLEVPKSAEAMKLNPDFYFKTMNKVGYESQEPAEVAALMKTIKKPWIAFKILGAGRMTPKDGFDMAYGLGADFVNVGMYDFQVKENVSLAREIISSHARRDRTWV